MSPSTLIKLGGGAVALAALAHAPAAANGREADVVCVPFELVGGHLVVKVRVNGHGPYRFLLDTGASDMGRADTRLSAALRLRKRPPTTNDDSLNTAAVDVVQADAVELGGLRRENVDLLSRDYNTTPRPDGLRLGIIGRGFYADRLLTVDYPAKQLRFSRTARLQESDPATLPYERPFRTPVTIGEVAAVGAVDTGSNLTLHVPESLLPRIRTDEPTDGGVARRANTTFKMQRARVRDTFRIGIVGAADVDARFSGLATEVNIGNGFLADYVLQIDQRSKRIALRPGGDPVVAADRRRGCGRSRLGR